jgi:hypothetical protein
LADRRRAAKIAAMDRRRVIDLRAGADMGPAWARCPRCDAIARVAEVDLAAGTARGECEPCRTDWVVPIAQGPAPA